MINLEKVLGEESAVKQGGFAGAVLMTYTLNLAFFENIVGRALDRSGCANVLVIADPDGYAGAMELGAAHVNGAGRRYICAPIDRTSRGLQHVKLALLAGPTHGHVLIGSGNLTFHGYGRNLELFSQFEWQSDEPDLVAGFAFRRVWQFIRQLEPRLPRVASDHLAALGEKAPWLNAEIGGVDDFCIWDSSVEPIWDQLLAWRRARNLESSALQSLTVISPYYDADGESLRKAAADLKAAQLAVRLDATRTRLNLLPLKKDWIRRSRALDIAGLTARAESRRPRPLHAKAIIGVEVSGAWCLSGSANMTAAALRRTWSTGGNLELVTFQWQPNPHAFDAVLADSAVKSKAITVDELIGNDTDPSEHPAVSAAAFALAELTARGLTLTGRVVHTPVPTGAVGALEFIRTRRTLGVSIDSMGSFSIELPTRLMSAEAARLRLGTQTSGYRWIDQPEELARFGARAYHARVSTRLETFDGAEDLFKDLMNFLWERVDLEKITDDALQTRRARTARGGTSKTDEEPSSAEPPPPVEAFFTREKLVEFVSWGVRHHSAPFDRSGLSLRDLLSITLLRLTTPTQPPDPSTDATDDPDGIAGDEGVQETVEQEEARRLILTRLQDFVVHYCRKYAARLADPAFVRQVGAELLFANHFLLGRVLMEFAATVEPFTTDDLYECFWRIWAPLAWPALLGLNGPGALSTLSKDGAAHAVMDAWQKHDLGSLSAMMAVRALGKPPSWRDGLWEPERVEAFLATRELVRRVEEFVGPGGLTPTTDGLHEARGAVRPADLVDIPPEPRNEVYERICVDWEAIRQYQSPADERLSRLLAWHQLRQRGEHVTDAADVLRKSILDTDLAEELNLLSSRNLPVMALEGWPDEDEQELFCPRCWMKLPDAAQAELTRHARLILCPVSSDVLIYWRLRAPEKIALR